MRRDFRLTNLFKKGFTLSELCFKVLPNICSLSSNISLSVILQLNAIKY